MSMSQVIVKSVCRAMERIAPLRFAEKWDNVGLLLESPVPRPNAHRVLLTIDLTTAVADEAISTNTCLIIAYHPPIFKPLPSLTLSTPLQRSLLRCAAAGISIYSPHSAIDAISTGVNAWLARAFYDNDDELTKRLGWVGEVKEEGIAGQGRVATLGASMKLGEAVKRVKRHLGIEHVQVAYPDGTDADSTISSVAICAGSGGSMLLGHPADVYFTGEMSHHEVLAAVASGHTVILCGHTNTERGYLPTLAARLTKELAQEAPDASSASAPEAQSLASLHFEISKADRHPLQIL